MRLVVCDDHRLLLEALGLALREHGHEVVALVSSPEDAVEELSGRAEALGGATG